MLDRLSRLAPLTGVLFAVLAVVAIVTGGESPGTNEPPAKIVAYYATHRSEVKTSALLFALAFLILVLFAASLRSYLRRTPAAEGLSALVLAGAVLIAAGVLITSGVEFGLANEIHHLGPEAVQTLNFITEEVAFLPVVGGAFLLAIASGLAILRGARLAQVARLGGDRAGDRCADPAGVIPVAAGVRDLVGDRERPHLSSDRTSRAGGSRSGRPERAGRVNRLTVVSVAPATQDAIMRAWVRSCGD